ncbi:TPA: hypothetical protein ACJ667_001664, partial [Streptococcus pyogenes]
INFFSEIYLKKAVLFLKPLSFKKPQSTTILPSSFVHKKKPEHNGSDLSLRHFLTLFSWFFS